MPVIVNNGYSAVPFNACDTLRARIICQSIFIFITYQISQLFVENYRSYQKNINLHIILARSVVASKKVYKCFVSMMVQS